MTAAVTETVPAQIASVMQVLGDTYRDEIWHWMPDRARAMDVIVGAILVQHTTWTNAERALEALRASDAIDTRVLVAMPDAEIAALVRVSGTPTVKARRLRATAETIERAGGIDAFLAHPLGVMRPLLLATHGIGPETADAIALYGAGLRTFVIDAYTRRVFGRIGVGPDAGADYDTWQRFFENALGRDPEDAADAGRVARGEHDAEAFQRYHGYIVLHAKARCRVRPLCDSCPLVARCGHGRVVVA